MLLGGLIGINDTWIRRRFAIKDCNTAIAGVYNVDDTTTNNFPTGAYKFGTLLVANSGFLDLSILFLTILMRIHTYIFGLLVTMEMFSGNGLKLK